MSLLRNPKNKIIAAWAEHCTGPGWSNNIIWVLIYTPDSKYRVEAIQPSNQTSAMLHLHKVSSAMNTTMIQMVADWRTKKPL